jgi:hypothetical protein
VGLDRAKSALTDDSLQARLSLVSFLAAKPGLNHSVTHMQKGLIFFFKTDPINL